MTISCKENTKPGRTMRAHIYCLEERESRMLCSSFAALFVWVLITVIWGADQQDSAS
jgi:hypothetical protein